MTVNRELQEAYNRLTIVERDTVEAAMDAIWAVFKQDGIPAAGDDRAADLAGALALFTIKSRRNAPSHVGHMVRPHV